jgi:O-antigen/teichoic acid export membrane protein
VLAARSRFGALAGSLVAENGIRCLGVGALALAGVDDPVGYGLCLVAGYLVAVPRPGTVRTLRWRGTAGLLAPARFLFGAGLSQLVHQVLLTGGPVLLALSGGSPAEVTLLFAALALFRAPYMLALGLAGQLSAHVARLAGRGDGTAVAALVTRLLAGGAVLGLLGALGGALLGPWLLPLVFGPEVTMAPGQAAVVAAGCSLALACLGLTVVALARGAARRSAAAWLGATVAATALFGLLVLTTGASPSDRVAWSFLVAEAVALAGLGVAAGQASRTRVRSPRDVG